MDNELDLLLTPEGLAPWSFSKLKLLQKCPLQFYLKYIKRLKVDIAQLDEDRLRTEVGSALHNVLETSMGINDVNKAFARARHKFAKKIPKDSWEELVASQYANVVEFLRRKEEFEAINPIKRFYTEKRMAVTKDWESCSFFDDNAYFRGVIDLILHLNNDDILIIDHKTGGSGEYGIRNYEFQLDVYKPLYHFGVENVKGAQAGIHFIKSGDIVTSSYSSLDDVVSTIPKKIDFFIETAIDKVLEKGYFYYERQNLCKYCDFKEMCKAGKRGTSGELQVYEKESAQIVEEFLKHAA